MMFTTINHPAVWLLSVIPQLLNFDLSHINMTLLELKPLMLVFFSLQIFCIAQKLSWQICAEDSLNCVQACSVASVHANISRTFRFKSRWCNKLSQLGRFPNDKQFLCNAVFSSFTAEPEFNTLSMPYFHASTSEAFLDLKSTNPASPASWSHHTWKSWWQYSP